MMTSEILVRCVCVDVLRMDASQSCCSPSAIAPPSSSSSRSTARTVWSWRRSERAVTACSPYLEVQPDISWRLQWVLLCCPLLCSHCCLPVEVSLSVCLQPPLGRVMSLSTVWYGVSPGIVGTAIKSTAPIPRKYDTRSLVCSLLALLLLPACWRGVLLARFEGVVCCEQKGPRFWEVKGGMASMRLSLCEFKGVWCVISLQTEVDYCLNRIWSWNNDCDINCGMLLTWSCAARERAGTCFFNMAEILQGRQMGKGGSRRLQARLTTSISVNRWYYSAFLACCSLPELVAVLPKQHAACAPPWFSRSNRQLLLFMYEHTLSLPTSFTSDIQLGSDLHCALLWSHQFMHWMVSSPATSCLPI